MSKSFRTNCIETVVDTRGKVLNYRMTFPVPRDGAHEIHEKFACVKSSLNNINNRFYVVLSDEDFDALWAYKSKLQMVVAQFKIERLTIKRDGAMMEYTSYLKSLNQ